MAHQQQAAQAVMKKLSVLLKIRALTANLEHEPSSTCDYWMFADTFTYQKVYCRAVVTIHTSGKIDVGLYAKSQCDSRPEGFRWGISRATATEAVAEFPKVIHQATHATTGSWTGSPIEHDYIPKHQPLAPKVVDFHTGGYVYGMEGIGNVSQHPVQKAGTPKVADFTATDYATLNARMDALMMDTFIGDDPADKTLQDKLINLFAKLD